jgi:hypothetical protein
MNRTERRANAERLRKLYDLTDRMAERTPMFACDGTERTPERVWMSTAFLAMLYREGTHLRLTVNRTGQGEDGRWLDGIAWDDLMRVKAECGYGERWAVELYPADAAVVNDANMRHLWLLEEVPAFGWNRASR